MTRAPVKPYTFKQAAEAIGMSRNWLRERMVESRALRATCFRTKGKTGHFRFNVEAFLAWWQEHQAATAIARPAGPRRQRRARAPGYSTGTTGASDILAVLRGS